MKLTDTTLSSIWSANEVYRKSPFINYRFLKSANPVVFGSGLSVTTHDSYWHISDAGAISLEQAIENQDYLEFGFSTSSGIPNGYLSLVSIVNGFSTDSPLEANTYKMVLLIYSGSSEAGTRLTSELSLPFPRQWVAESFNLISKHYFLKPHTEYRVRAYIFYADSNNTTVVLGRININVCTPCRMANPPMITHRIKTPFDLPIKLSVDDSYCTYQWTTGDTTPEISVGSSGTYSIIVTDAHGCLGTSSVAVKLTPLQDISDYSTLSQEDWAASNGKLTNAFFAMNFPFGLTIGQTGRSIHFYTADDIKKFLPKKGYVDKLRQGDLFYPSGKSIGKILWYKFSLMLFGKVWYSDDNTFAGNLIALRLNLALNPNLKDFIINSSDQYNGWTVQKFYDEANAKISSVNKVSSAILSNLSETCEQINHCFRKKSTGFLSSTLFNFEMAALPLQ